MSTQQLLRPLLRYAVVTILLVGFLSVRDAEASHFRYGHIYCSPVDISSNTVACSVQLVWRRSFSSQWNDVGDTYIESFGIWTASGTSLGSQLGSVNVTMTVQQISGAQDWSLATGSFQYSFDTGDPHIIRFSGFARIGALNNRANSSWDVRALVDPDLDSAMPRSSVPPIFGYPQSTTSGSPVMETFPVSDPEGDPYRCRLADGSEVGGGPNPTGLSIDPNTCVLSWDNEGLPLGLYTVQVIIEEIDGSGNVLQHTPYDYLLELGGDPPDNDPPVCTLDPASPINTTVGSNVAFTVTATDPDTDDALEISVGGGALPTGATLNPGVPVAGTSPISTLFEWTPGSTGTELVTFSVFDGTVRTQCTMTINVTDEPACGMPSFDPPSVSGTTVTETIRANDASGLVLIEFADPDGDPYLIGGSVTDADGFVSTDGTTWEWDSANGPAPTTATFEITASSNELRYYINATNGCDNTHISDPVWEFDGLPQTITVLGNSPNPFNPQTTIRFALPEQMPVTVNVYDLMGRRVITLADREFGAGTQQVTWDGRNANGVAVSSGVYLYQVTTPGFMETHRMTLVK